LLITNPISGPITLNTFHSQAETQRSKNLRAPRWDNSFIGGVDGAQGRFELDYWGTSFREAAEYVNQAAPANSTVWVEGPAHLFSLYARNDLKIYSSGEAERDDHYNYVIATTRYNFDKTSYPDAKIIYRIMRGNAILSVIKQP